MGPVTVDANRLKNLDAARNLEWIVGNGRGGFAMCSAPNILTRRYHGLLVAAIKPPLDRWVLLAKLEATAIVGEQRYELSSNDYPSIVHPAGYQALESFAPSPNPTWRFRPAPDVLIEQTLFMPASQDTTYVQFRLLEGPAAIDFEVRPLCTSRFMHDMAERPDLGEPQLDDTRGGFALRWNGRPALHLDSNGRFSALPDWYYQFVLHAEAARGQPDRQDLFMPGPIRATLQRGDSAGLVIVASTAPVAWTGWSQVRDRAAKHRMLAPLPRGVDDKLAVALSRATDAFIVGRGDKMTVIAGYPWFGDWGRDTFISLPGLCLVTGRYDTARRIIDAFSDFVDGGLIPNRFPDDSEKPEYNTVDATLWFIHAIDRYLAYSGDWSFVAERLFPIISSILEAHERGTRHRIKVDSDGLLAAGEPGVQLTWMDAKFGDWVVTPRIGKPVEINALWYNALRIAADYADRLEQRTQATRWRALADRAFVSFNARFWNTAVGCCYDVIDCDHVAGRFDPSIRPNQVFAAALTHPILERSRWQSMVRVVQQKLFTPIGLRTLDPAHPDYKPHYTGDMRSRDGAYHQGTVWPWLLGGFITAYVRASGETPAARKSARELLSGLEAHLAVAGLESVSEVAEGQPPHRPDGCPFQAWSVAEPLRAIVEDVCDIRPAADREPASSESTSAVTRSGSGRSPVAP